MFLNCGVGEDSWEPLGLQGDQPVHSKANQSWIFIGRTEAEAEAPIIWTPDVKSRFIEKDPDARRDRSQEEKGKTEAKIIGWHHRLNGHEFEQAQWDGEEQGILECLQSIGLQESDKTEWLNNDW